MRIIQQKFFTVIAFFLLFKLSSFICTAQPDTSYFVFVSLRGDNGVAVYRMNPHNGELEKEYTQTVSGGPASLAIHPSKQYLYVAQRSANSVSAYSIDKTTGRLNFINSIPVVDNPVYIATDKSGRFLLSAYFNASKAAVYPIDSGGALNSLAVQTISTGTNPHAIMSDPSNRFLYISNMTGNKIQQFAFDSVSGNFAHLEPANILPPSGTGPRHFVFHGTKNIVYFVNEIGNSVTAYTMNITSGILEEIQTISTLPPDYTSTNKCADIHITPDNRFLYASNRGHESIAAFRTDTITGQLTVIDNYPTVNTPREFDIDPSGKFLFAAGENSNNLACYRINKESGVLDSLYTIQVGKTPSWVLTVAFDNSLSTVNRSAYNKLSTGMQAYCYPNPFKFGCAIALFINERVSIDISIFDLSGRIVKTLKNEPVNPGYSLFEWDGKDNAGMDVRGGIYYCNLVSGNINQVLKMMLIR